MQPVDGRAFGGSRLRRKLLPLWVACLACMVVASGLLLSRASVSALLPVMLPSSGPTALPFNRDAKEYSADDLGFAAQFPSAPTHKDYEVSADGKTVHMSVLTAVSGPVTYIAAAYEVDCMVLNNDATDWLRSSTNGFKESIEKTLSATASMTSEVPSNESGGKGLVSEFALTAKGSPIHASVKVVHTGSRLFAIAAVSPRNSDQSGFLRSFRITKAPPATVNICRLPEAPQLSARLGPPATSSAVLRLVS